MQIVKIKIVTSTPTIYNESLHFDSIITYLESLELPPVVIPGIVELKSIAKVWESADGYPLFGCSDLYPMEVHEFQNYTHRRYPVDRAFLAKKATANLKAGRYKESRKGFITIPPCTWEAIAIADIEILEKTLKNLKNIGPRGSIGYGRVMSFSIECSDEFSIKTILSCRPIPKEAAEYFNIQGDIETLGWTPPYWNNALYAFGIRGRKCF